METDKTNKVKIYSEGKRVHIEVPFELVDCLDIDCVGRNCYVRLRDGNMMYVPRKVAEEIYAYFNNKND